MASLMMAVAVNSIGCAMMPELVGVAVNASVGIRLGVAAWLLLAYVVEFGGGFIEENAAIPAAKMTIAEVAATKVRLLVKLALRRVSVIG